MRKIACKFFFLRALAKVQSNLKGNDRNWISHSYANTNFITSSGKRKESIQKRQLLPFKVSSLQESVRFFPK